MSEGRNRNWRKMLVAQSALVWFDGRSENLVDFVETGLLGSSRSKAAPENTAVMEEIAKHWKFGG